MYAGTCVGWTTRGELSMKFHVMTLFPDMIENYLHTSILGRASVKGLLDFHTVNIRDYTQDKHGKVDDYPYGGGAGMLIQAQPVYDAYQTIIAKNNKKIRTVYVTPQGRTFEQKLAAELAQEDEVVFLCGHYEGVDERVLEEIVTDYISIGDYVLTGGELPALVMIDAISRMIPGVLNNEFSAETESFHKDLLEYPQYTRPEIWHDKKVPEVLLSGNHKKINEWRLEQSVNRTKIRRFDLYKRYCENKEVIKRLLKKKRVYIHMAEFLERGIGELFYTEGLNICMGNSNITLISAQSKDEAVKLLSECKEHISTNIITPQTFVRDILIEQAGEWMVRPFIQACYTNKVPLHVSYKNIKLYENGTIVAYDKDRCLGEITITPDGSIGFPYIEDVDNREELKQSLLAFAVNKQLFEMMTPFIHLEQEKQDELIILKEMGFYVSDVLLWKLTNLSV